MAISEKELGRLADERIVLIRKRLEGKPYSKKRLDAIEKKMDEYFKPFHEAAVRKMEKELAEVDAMVREHEEALVRLGLVKKKKQNRQ